MFVRNVFIPSKQVTVCPSDFTATSALDLLRSSGYRCLPVVDSVSGEYKGQLYKVHLLEHLFEICGDPGASIETLVTEADSVVSRDDSLMTALLKIDRLPFLAVTGEDGRFSGIVTHSVIMELFRDGFGMKTGGLSFTVAAGEYAGALRKLLDLVSIANIEGVHTFDNGSPFLRRITFTLSGEYSSEKTQWLKEKLDANGFRVLHVEAMGPR